MNNIFFKSDLRVDVGNTAGQDGLLPGQVVHLFVEVSRGAVLAGTAILDDDGTSGKTALRCRLYSRLAEQ